MKKMDNHEFADYISSVVDPKTSVNFNAEYDPTTGETEGHYSLAGVLLDKRLGFIANYYGGGAPFFFLANSEGKVNELFRKELDAYLRINTPDYMIEVFVEEPESNRDAAYTSFFVHGGLDALADALFTSKHDDACYIYRDKSSKIGYAFRKFLFVDAYMVIGCEQQGHRTFYYEFYRGMESQERFRARFRSYLLACGVTDNATSSDNNAPNTSAEPACDREQEV